MNLVFWACVKHCRNLILSFCLFLLTASDAFLVLSARVSHPNHVLMGCSPIHAFLVAT